MNSYLRFFFGTPQRFLGTLAGIGTSLVFVRLFPGVLADACNQLFAELGPLAMQAIQLGLVVAVVVFMMKAAFNKK
ncbi:MAG: hypothetical protein WC668_00055 [Patescibacteria group bacterium]|jgi:hypothetical protein